MLEFPFDRRGRAQDRRIPRRAPRWKAARGPCRRRQRSLPGARVRSAHGRGDWRFVPLSDRARCVPGRQRSRSQTMSGHGTGPSTRRCGRHSTNPYNRQSPSRCVGPSTALARSRSPRRVARPAGKRRRPVRPRRSSRWPPLLARSGILWLWRRQRCLRIWLLSTAFQDSWASTGITARSSSNLTCLSTLTASMRSSSQVWKPSRSGFSSDLLPGRNQLSGRVEQRAFPTTTSPLGFTQTISTTS